MPFCAEGKTKVNPCFKYTLLLGTFLHWLVGIAVVSAGVWAYLEKQKFYYQPIEDVYDVMFDLSVVLIVFGLVMFLINICGFLGSLREIICFLTIFYIGLTLIFLLEVFAGSLLFAFKTKAMEFLGDHFKIAFVKDYLSEEEGVMDYFHENFDCCGINSYEDWNENEYYNCSAAYKGPLKCAVPFTCCKDQDSITPGLTNSLCGAGALSLDGNLKNIWTDGCLKKFVEWVEDNLPLIGGVAFAIAVPQLAGIFLGRQLVFQIQDQLYIYQREMGHSRGQRD